LSKEIYLRLPLPEDADLMWQIETDSENMLYTTFRSEISKEDIESFILSDHNIYKYHQIRYSVIFENKAIGFYDLYDADFDNKKAGIGIIIKSGLRSKGLGSSALKVLEETTNIEYGLQTLYAVVAKENTSAQKFFQSNGYKLKIPGSGVQIFPSSLYFEKNIKSN
jgi:diamine N-acetyltransferase